MTKTVHGESAQGGSNKKVTLEYRTWTLIKSRCYNRNHHKYYLYGGRGIRVCLKWRRSYSAFLRDMGRKPSPNHTIDRIRTDGNYEPGNCRWATKKEQNRNKRTNRLLTVDGETLCLSEWAERMGISINIIYMRLKYGWSIRRAIYAPVKPKSSRGKTRGKKTNP